MTNHTVSVWISDDGTVGAPDPSNLYRYVGNDPTNEVDPSGLGAIKTIWDGISGKYIGRAEWGAMAWSIEKAGFPLTAELLRDSLQDNPPVQRYKATSTLTTAMRNSPEFRALVMRIGASAPVGNIPKQGPKSCIFNASKDLFAGVHEAEVNIENGKKQMLRTFNSR